MLNRYEPTKVYTIAELTREIRGTLERGFNNLWVGGEISNFRTPSSGHWYFTLKDEKAQLATVMFRGSNRYIKFRPEDGMEIIVRGRVSVYEPRGQYQLIAEHMEPKGVGALQLAFEQLRNKLEAEGLFAPERKRPLPFLPRRIGLVTSISGAVVRDICHVLFRRFPGVTLQIRPVRVQGAGASEEVACALRYLYERGDADVVIVARGGGSLEDLWAFNEEPVARAIAEAPMPVVSAVGHETDFTIADFVADVRAPTPSAAAEIVVPVKSELEASLQAVESRLARWMAARVRELRVAVHDARAVLADPRLALATYRRRVDEAEETLVETVRRPIQRSRRRAAELERRLWSVNPRATVAIRRQRVAELRRRLEAASKSRVGVARERVISHGGVLEALSPLKVLARGYSLASLPDGTLVRDSSQVSPGDRFDVRLERGRLAATVDSTGED